MSSSALDFERKTLAGLREDYEGRGYRFIEHPAAHKIPDFLRGYQPDALALGEGDRVIIEVTTSQDPSKRRADLARLGSSVSAEEGWRYVVVYAGQDLSEAADLPRSSKAQVDAAIEEAQELIRSGHARAAMLQAWSVMEAVARRLHPHDIRFASRPLSPAETVERLAIEGSLHVDEARTVRRLRSLRNLLVHGDFAAKVSASDVEFMLSVAQRINTGLAD